MVAEHQIEKMSKSRGNVINPDDMVEEYGADTMRIYEMFMGPLEASKPWNTNGVEGTYPVPGPDLAVVLSRRTAAGEHRKY